MTFQRFASCLFALCLLAPALALPGVAAQKSDEMPITTSSKEALALFVKARDLAENVEVAAAVPLYEQALAKDKNFAMAYAGLANAAGGFVRFQENAKLAIALMDKVSPGERLWLRSLEAQSNGDQAARREHMESLVKMFPRDKHVRLAAGNLARGANDERAAVAHFQEATRIDKQFAAAYNQLAYSQMALDDMKGAEQSLKTYISLRPDSPNPYDSYAEMLQRAGRFDESTAQYKKALEKDPNFGSSIVRIGDNYMFKGDMAAAREWYRQAHDRAQIDGDRVTALNALRDSYVVEGKTDEALKTNSELLAVAEKGGLVQAIVTGHRAAALIQLEAGNIAQARRHLEDADKVSEASALGARAKEGNRVFTGLAMSRALSREGNLDGATAQLAKARAMVEARNLPAEQRALAETEAFMALDQKNYDAALQHFAKGAQDDPYVMYYTAVAYEAKGDKASAAKMYSRVASWTQPDLGLVMVRARAAKKSAEGAPK